MLKKHCNHKNTQYTNIYEKNKKMFENKIKKKKKKHGKFFLTFIFRRLCSQKRKILEFFLGFSCPLRNVTW